MADHDSVITPALYVVATPLGNLSDITLRAIETLRAADVVAAEDTRRSRALLRHHGIGTPLLSVREHNEQAVAGRLIERLRRGQRVALVSDAGTPGICDPGARAVARVRAAGFAVVPIPGPNAAIAALSAAGIADERFVFCGYLPARHAERLAQLNELAGLPFALVFHEAPHRIVASVRDMAQALGARRRIVIARELTKRFESIVEIELGQAADWLEAGEDRRRGEFVLIVTGAEPDRPRQSEGEAMLRVLLEALTVKQAVALAARITGAPRNELYALALRLKAGVPAPPPVR
jgi:16S rRNA (cytidine1402-2'-O)-methyltransferase